MNQRIERMDWRVLYTNPRAEMKVAERLEKIGVEAYCPARMEMRQRSDRKKKIWVPLLPSMVLVKIDEREKNKVSHRSLKDSFMRPRKRKTRYFFLTYNNASVFASTARSKRSGSKNKKQGHRCRIKKKRLFTLLNHALDSKSNRTHQST